MAAYSQFSTDQPALVRRLLDCPGLARIADDVYLQLWRLGGKGGASLTILRLDPELEALLDAPAETAARIL